jgi:hypothetical protein
MRGRGIEEEMKERNDTEITIKVIRRYAGT